MALPAFFSRVGDSLRPVADVDPETLSQKLTGIRVHLDLCSDDPAASGAFMLASNLAARLYPHLALSARTTEAIGDGSAGADQQAQIAAAARLILRINPQADIDILTPGPTSTNSEANQSPRAPQAITRTSPAAGPSDIRLMFGAPNGASETSGAGGPTDAPVSTVEPDAATITVDAYGWSVLVDPATVTANADDPVQDPRRGHPLAWLAAAAIGMAEVFRSVFAHELGARGRIGPQSGGFDLLTGDPVDVRRARTMPARGNPSGDLGEVHLIGAGAIGQAAAYALTQLEVTGVLHVVDPETITLSNLQRYLLTDVTSIGASKVAMVHGALTGEPGAGSQLTSRLEVHPFVGRWGDSETHLQVSQALVALDTARDRIVVAASEPRHAYNAWTQVTDLGWSRHEAFGAQPCLACLYYPDQARPNEHELIAEAIQQHPLRVLAYLIYDVPIGYPLPALPAIAEMPPPGEAEVWGQVALIEDLIAAGVVEEPARAAWSQLSVGALYRDGICAGGLMPVGNLPSDVLVPMAHQSALAGIMLVAELLWSRDPDLASLRDSSIEHRYDVHRGFPQIVPRPRERTPHCLCSDPAYVAASASGL